AAGKPERHPNQGAGPRPCDEIVGSGDQKALVGKLGFHVGKNGIVRANRLAGARIENALRGGCDQSHGGINPIPAPPSSIHILSQWSERQGTPSSNRNQKGRFRERRLPMGTRSSPRGRK